MAIVISNIFPSVCFPIDKWQYFGVQCDRKAIQWCEDCCIRHTLCVVLSLNLWQPIVLWKWTSIDSNGRFKHFRSVNLCAYIDCGCHTLHPWHFLLNHFAVECLAFAVEHRKRRIFEIKTKKGAADRACVWHIKIDSQLPFNTICENYWYRVKMLHNLVRKSCQRDAERLSEVKRENKNVKLHVPMARQTFVRWDLFQ